MRASKEKAPGPTNAIARAKVATLSTTKPERTNPFGAVTPKKCDTTRLNTTIRLTRGVITPNKRHKPVANEIDTISEAFSSGHAARNCAPVWMTALATTVRSSNKPKPGHPVGNVVNSRRTSN